MGFHVDLLEHGWCTTQLLPFEHLLGQSCSIRLQMESIRLGSAVRTISVRLLGLGYHKQPEKSLSPAGAWRLHSTKDIPTIAVADCGESKNHQDQDW